MRLYHYWSNQECLSSNDTASIFDTSVNYFDKLISIFLWVELCEVSHFEQAIQGCLSHKRIRIVASLLNYAEKPGVNLVDRHLC